MQSETLTIDSETVERADYPIDVDTASSLVDWYLDGHPPQFSPLCLGWSFRRSLGDEGYAPWCDLMVQFDEYEAPESLPATWQTFDRPICEWADTLLFDEMDCARWEGWQPPADLQATFDRLAVEETAIEAADQRITRVCDFLADEAEAKKALDQQAHTQLDSAEAETLSQQIRDLQSKGVIPGPVPVQKIGLDDFVAYMPTHQYVFKPTREMWPGSSVDARLGSVEVFGREKPMKASAWLDLNRPVEQATWAPGEEMEITDRLVADGGWITRPGCAVFNLYRPPVIQPKAGDASAWVGLVQWVFPNEADHIIKWLAHRVQRPWEKINHGLVFGGEQGIGKDTILEPVKHAVGPWNFVEISPKQMLGRFNGFVKSVILRVSEARDLGEVDRFAFYESSKTLMAAPPDVLRVDEKNLREHAIFNVCGVVLTTNNKDALHLPASDRRHFVAWSQRKQSDLNPDYFTAVYRWFAGEGNAIVANYLANLDLSDFDPKAPPPKTPAFWSIVDASRAPEDAEMRDVLDRLGQPDAAALSDIVAKAEITFKEWLTDRKNRRKIPFRMDECGYVPVRNPSASDGHWVVGSRRQAVYAKKELSLRDQIAAAGALSKAAAANR